MTEADFEKHLRKEPQRDVAVWAVKKFKWDFKKHAPTMAEVIDGRHYTLDYIKFLEQHDITLSRVEMFLIIDKHFNARSNSGRVSQRPCEIQLLKWLFNSEKLDPRVLSEKGTSTFPFNYMRRDVVKCLIEEYLMFQTTVKYQEGKKVNAGWKLIIREKEVQKNILRYM